MTNLQTILPLFFAWSDLIAAVRWLILARGQKVLNRKLGSCFIVDCHVDVAVSKESSRQYGLVSFPKQFILTHST